MVKIKPYLKILGIKKLKPQQKEIINNFLQNKDTLGILPTGFGKSVCYILPHLITGKNVIVISPLISLMEDQYRLLHNQGIDSILFNSTNHKHYGNDSDNPDSELSRLKKGLLKGILYFSPESFLKREHLVRELLKSESIALISIDEAHCIDTWSEFRNSYNYLSCIRDWLKYLNINLPLLAVTASATKYTQSVICNKLKLIKPNIIQASFYRDNLALKVIKKNKFNTDLVKIKNIINAESVTNKKVLIYAKTIEDCEKITELLNLYKLKSDTYHGSLSPKKRKLIQENYTGNKLNIIVATIAFGMGINITNINLIIHYGISKDLESYYQELGRGGRDGDLCKCYLFWSKKDFQTNRYFLNNIKNSKFRDNQMERTIEVEKFIYNTSNCRMGQILNYFGESECIACNKCDACTDPKTSDLTDVGIFYKYLIAKTFFDLGYGCGSNTLICILTGKKNNRIKYDMKQLNTYNSLTKIKKDDLSDIIRVLHHQEFLSEQKIKGCSGSFLKLSPDGLKWIKLNKDKIEKSLSIINNLFINLKKTSSLCKFKNGNYMERYKMRIKN